MQPYQLGDKVRYHPIIGGPHDEREYEIRAIQFGKRTLVWLKGKSGCVAAEALSPVQPCEGVR